MGLGKIAGTIDSVIFDGSGVHPSIGHRGGAVYAIAYIQSGNGAYRSNQIQSDGDVSNLLGPVTWNPSSEIDMVYLSGDVFGAAFRFGATTGRVYGLWVNSGGGLGGYGNAHDFDATCHNPCIVRVLNLVAAVVYRGPADHGLLKTIDFSPATPVTRATHTFDGGYGATPNIFHVSGNVYAIAYQGPSNHGWLKTVSISTDGVTISAISSYEFDASYADEPCGVHVSGNTYAIAYQGPSNHGWLKTVSISTDGVTISAISSYELDDSFLQSPSIIHILDNVYTVAYQGPSNHGIIKTIGIENDGTIGGTIDSFEFDTGAGLNPDMIHIDGSTCAIAYQNASDQGILKTIETSAPTPSRCRFTGGMLHRAVH